MPVAGTRPVNKRAVGGYPAGFTAACHAEWVISPVRKDALLFFETFAAMIVIKPTLRALRQPFEFPRERRGDLFAL